MITQEHARHFAQEWVEAWNAHDIDRIMSHYAEDVIIVSPIARKILGNQEVRGIDAVKSYFLKGLQHYPDLRFDIQNVLCGHESVVVLYSNQNSIKAGEFMLLNDEGKVVRMYAHYSE